MQNEEIPVIKNILFKNKQNIPWNAVEQFLKKYIGETFIIAEYQDCISIDSTFPEEYSESRYTKSLRGAVAKAKANASQILELLILRATNRRWVENKDVKHNKNASEGWYRYDTFFAMQVQGSNEKGIRINKFRATLVVRITSKGLFLYDVINIKKEASTPL